MKYTIILIIALLSLNISFSQNYDLIVTTDGDSIACRIDSFSTSRIFFYLKLKHGWTRTAIKKSQVSETKFALIDEGTVDSSNRTSYINAKEESDPLKDINKNAIYAENIIIFGSINYSRVIVNSKKVGIHARIGISQSYGAGPKINVGSSLIVGGPNHFGDIGILAIIDEGFNPLGQMGYRFIGRRFLMFKCGLLITGFGGLPVFPYLGFGISF